MSVAISSKSEGKNIWLDPTRTNAYEFYQFWVNVDDADIIDFLKRLSMKAPEEIQALEEQMKVSPETRPAQKALAEELTLLVHGEEGLAQALKITETLFKGSIQDLSVEELRNGLVDAEKFEIEDDTSIIDGLVLAGICKSKGDARKLIQQGSVQVNGNKVESLETTFVKADAFDQEFAILKKGKRNYYIFLFK